ncbi:DUF1433 domain-containing protein [Enterococcus caccae]|nr:DUF1433 domain-containing protein [Enterococcus caccae]
MEESEMNYYMKEQKPRIEKFLKYHYNNIDSVTLTGTQKNPMGGFFIQGYINGDENLSISVQGEVGTNIEYVDGLNIDFDKKNNKSNNNKSVSEIEAEEKTTMSSSARMSLWKEKYGSKTT